MRTIQEILDKIEEVKEDDWMGTQRGDLFWFLDYENAKQYLKDGTTLEEFELAKSKYIDPIQSIKDYMDFAWEKANDCRGISAGRSIEHMQTWLWLDGKDDLAKEIGEYYYYGKPQLVKICKLYSIDWKQYDNEKWVNSESDHPKTAEEVLKFA